MALIFVIVSLLREENMGENPEEKDQREFRLIIYIASLTTEFIMGCQHICFNAHSLG